MTALDRLPAPAPAPASGPACDPDGSGSPLGDLARFGDAVAVVTEDGSLTYADLAARVRARADRLGDVRRLVLVACGNDLESVVTYLAVLEGGHVALLVPSDADVTGLVAAYRPDVVAGGDVLDELVEGSGHDLHHDLALLLSTSGSTGSPKLVRLSRRNLRANAESIATYLSLTGADLALTTLPLHYCYGLSVLHSHLLVGAGLLLTDRSVTDERTWELARAAGATSFAGVPYTFDLLDASGFEGRDLPSLRYVTQAGGRLAPERVRAYAELGRRRGFDLVVMYGQTEATARMAYLPPHLAASRPEAVGVAVPGGSLRVDAPDRSGVGELVYAGDNVMLGYAETPADLALGRTVSELRTGDLARIADDGLVEVVGRRSRFAKVLGVRLDLDRVEDRLEQAGVHGRAVEHDGRLAVFVTRHLDVDRVRVVAAGAGVPRHLADVHVVDVLPSTASGKPDYACLATHAALLSRPPDDVRREATAEAVRDLLAELLGRPDAGEHDSFVSLRGDSLSFVEVSLRLEPLVGTLPPDWPTRAARDLVPATVPPRPARWGGAAVESSVLLRVLAIVLVVGTHANLLTLKGGAHVLLALTGFNLARFQVVDQPRADRLRGLLRSARQVVVPAALWIGGVTLVSGTYDVPTALMLNNLLGADTWDVRWQFWFLEVVVWSALGVAALLLVPGLDRWERRRPFTAALLLLAGCLALRFELAGVEAGPTERYALPVVLWCVALGWLCARSRTTGQRVLASAATLASVPGFFGEPVREAIVVAGVLALLWVRAVVVPRVLVPALSLVASSSLFVYLTHWQVYPHLEVDHPLLATLASFGVGIAAWAGWTRGCRTLTRLRRRAPSPRRTPRTLPLRRT